jgi:hypothetical protein
MDCGSTYKFPRLFRASFIPHTTLFSGWVGVTAHKDRLYGVKCGKDQNRAKNLSVFATVCRRASIEHVRRILSIYERRPVPLSPQRKIPRGRDDEERLVADIVELTRQ